MKSNILIVSHSYQVAKSVFDLMNEFKRDLTYKLEWLGGLDEKTFGTDPFKITELISKKMSDSDLLVFLDFGSSIFNVQFALEQLQNFEHNYRIVNAPLIEGCFLAINMNTGTTSFENFVKQIETEVLAFEKK